MDDKTGEFRYESRSTDESVSLELLNCTEKDRFMNGEKNVAIISEAASSGISLQVIYAKCMSYCVVVCVVLISLEFLNVHRGFSS